MATGKLVIENNIVVGYEGEDSHIVIPEGITAIGDGAFKDCTWLNSVAVESTVFRSVGENAFYGCSLLQSITFKSLHGSIGEHAFGSCMFLESIDIPHGALEICAGAFTLCVGLCFVSIPSSVMLIADTAFETVTCRKLMFLCASLSEAAKYADRHHIPYRSPATTARYKLESASIARKSLETRTFNLFGHKIVAPNSLNLHIEIPAHYQGKKESFFNSIFKYIPEDMYAGGNGERITKLIDVAIEDTIRRLENHGVFTSRIRINPHTNSAYGQIAELIKTLGDYRTELSNITSNNLDESQERLLREAESKVTGLSYGVIGDGLTLAAYAIDDFRERQNQRRAAYAEASQEYKTLATRAYDEVNKAYKNTLQNIFKPALHTATNNLLDALRDVEIQMLKDYDLLEDIAEGTYDEAKANAIINRSYSADKEYAVGLALKTFPLCQSALSFAGKNHLATDELLEYISFMKINDEATLTNVLLSNQISLAAMVDRYEDNKIAYKKAIAKKCENLQKRISAMTTGSHTEMAWEFQEKIEDMISCELWIKVSKIIPILPQDVVIKLGVTQATLGTEDVFESLGQRIFDYNEKYENTEQRAAAIAKSDIPLSEKILALYAERETIGTQKISNLLRKDFTAFTKAITEEHLLPYIGDNSDKIKAAILNKITAQLGDSALSKLVIMKLSVNVFGGGAVCVTTADSLAEALTKKYIENQKQIYIEQLSNQLRSVSDYRQAFSIAKDYLWRTDRLQLRTVLWNHMNKVQSRLSDIDQDINLTASSMLAEVEDLAQSFLDTILSSDCWLVYAYCAAPNAQSVADAQKHMETIRANAIKTVKNELMYRKAVATFENAKNATVVTSAYNFLLQVDDNYKDCAAKKVAYKQRIEELTKKSRQRVKMIAIPIVCVIIVCLIILNTVIIPNNKYNDALALIEEGNIDAAYSVFLELGRYKDSSERVSNIRLTRNKETIKNCNVGGYIKLGTYEQNGEIGDGKEDIEWLVLKISDNKALVISRYVIDCQPYQEEYARFDNVTWEESDIRIWLNNSFLNTSFTEAEKDMIGITVVPAHKNPAYERSPGPGNATNDKIFLLSAIEADELFSSYNERQCKPTAYADTNGANVDSDNGNSWWWLRTPGKTLGDTTYIKSNGIISTYGEFVIYSSGGVRPAMWIDLSKVE